MSQFRALLRDRLRAHPDIPAQIVASELYELYTGFALMQETDPNNGEDYLYKSAEGATMASLAVHPLVARWFALPTDAPSCAIALAAIASNHILDVASNVPLQYDEPVTY